MSERRRAMMTNGGPNILEWYAWIKGYNGFTIRDFVELEQDNQTVIFKYKAPTSGMTGGNPNYMPLEYNGSRWIDNPDVYFSVNYNHTWAGFSMLLSYNPEQWGNRITIKNMTHSQICELKLDITSTYIDLFFNETKITHETSRRSQKGNIEITCTNLNLSEFSNLLIKENNISKYDLRPCLLSTGEYAIANYIDGTIIKIFTETTITVHN